MDTTRLIGEQIDQYRILSHIDRGGMADVYLAQDVDLERSVAFKVMLDKLALDEQYVRRFRREARTVARLDHPNIVQIYSTGQTPSGQPYIAMQFIEGGSLHEKLAELSERNKLLTTEQVLNIIRQLAIALSVAHQADVVHRDLKPSNVLIRLDGTPVLVDLGIAAVRSKTKLTIEGGLVGTPVYMSPEQIRGQPLDGRSDLYSLGIIFYELFAGALPFDANEFTAIMYKQLHEEPAPLHQIRPDLSPQTLSIVEKLLNKDPNQRFQTSKSLVVAIDQAIQNEGSYGPNPHVTQVLTQLDDGNLISRGSIFQAISASHSGKSTTAKLPSLRRKSKWIITTLLALAATLAIFTFLKPNEGRVLDKMVTAVPTTTSRATTVEAISNELEEIITAEPTSAATVTSLPVPTETTERVSPTAPVISEETILPTLSPPPVDWQSGTLTYLVTDNGGRSLYTLDLRDNNVPEHLYTSPLDRIIQGPLWSPDGRLIIFYDTLGRLYLVNSQTGQVNFGSHECTVPAWSPDGSQIICRSSDPPTFDIISATTGVLTRQIPRPGGASLPSWSPTQDEIVFADFNNTQTTIWRMALNDPVPILLNDNGTENYAPAWSPDGEWIAYQTNYESDLSDIWIMNRSGSSFQRLTTTPVGKWSRAPFWSPDGKYIAFVSDQAGSSQPEHGEIFVVSVTTGELYQVTQTGGRVYNWRVSWGP